MQKNPFLDPGREIVQGKTEEELRERAAEKRHTQATPDMDKATPPQQQKAGPSQPKPSLNSLNNDYLYVPHEAFEPLFKTRLISEPLYPEYADLMTRAGIYVLRHKLVVDDEVRQASRGIMDVSGYSAGQLLDDISWYESKRLVKALGHEMLTPAMYWCIVDYLKETGEDNETLDDMLRTEAEWFDALIMKTKGMKPLEYVSATAFADRWKGGVAVPVPYKTKVCLGGYLDISYGFFRRGDVEPRSGLPKRTRNEGPVTCVASSQIRSDAGQDQAVALYRGIEDIPPNGFMPSIQSRLLTAGGLSSLGVRMWKPETGVTLSIFP